MSGLDQKGTKIPHGINIPEGMFWIDDVAVLPSAAEFNLLNGLTATTTELNEYSVEVYYADGGTLGSCYVTIPHAGEITGLSVVNYAANASTKTVWLAKIGGVTVTAPAWETAATQAAGIASTVVPTAANVLTQGQVLEIASDGGSSSVMPCMITIKIKR